jgi:hypothetical protein
MVRHTLMQFAQLTVCIIELFCGGPIPRQRQALRGLQDDPEQSCRVKNQKKLTLLPCNLKLGKVEWLLQG